VNWTLVVWNEIRPLNAGDGRFVPLRLLLPLSQARTSLRLLTESLRSWKSRSLCSIATLTLKRSLVTFRDRRAGTTDQTVDHVGGRRDGFGEGIGGAVRVPSAVQLRHESLDQ